LELVRWCGSWCVELVEWRRLGGDVLGRGHVEVVHQLLEVVLPAGPGILSRVEIEGQGCAPAALGPQVRHAQVRPAAHVAGEELGAALGA